MSQLVLACDVGGTKTRLSLFERQLNDLRLVRTSHFASAAHATLAEIVAIFVGDAPPPLAAAGFGVAGPVSNGRVQTTNLPWVVDAAELAGQLALPAVTLLNDVEMIAWSVPQLGAHDLLALRDLAPRAEGNVAIIAAGTGLGVSALVRAGGVAVALGSEGGHADFAPRNELEVELWRFLAARFGRVSCERVLSGPGLRNIYDFLRDTARGSEESWLADELRTTDDASRTIASAALAERSVLCAAALDLFVAIYGAESGNWALRTLSGAGVYLGGGIAPKLFAPGPSPEVTARLRRLFTAAFVDKGRLSPLLVAMPVHVILSDQAPLIGAAHAALTAAYGG